MAQAVTHGWARGSPAPPASACDSPAQGPWLAQGLGDALCLRAWAHSSNGASLWAALSLVLSAGWDSSRPSWALSVPGAERSSLGRLLLSGPRKGPGKAEGLGCCCKGCVPHAGAFLGGRKQQERQTRPHSAAWKVESGHEEEEMSLQGQCCRRRSIQKENEISPWVCV